MDAFAPLGVSLVLQTIDSDLGCSRACYFPGSARLLRKAVQFRIGADIMSARELRPKQILSVRCPTCGAATGEVCELNSGAPRTEPHRDRKLSAADAVEMKLSKRSLSSPLCRRKPASKTLQASR